MPDGYTEEYTYQDDSNGLGVTVYAPEGVVPEGATLSASVLSEDDDAYAEAQTALANANTANGESDDYGFAALDIHFEDADGNEVEPNGDVYVVVDAESVLPEDANADSIAIQHHVVSDDTVAMTTVADSADETDGVVASNNATVQAAFSVDSFSTFTITWSGNFEVTVHYVDENGKEIRGSQTQGVFISNNKTISFDTYAGEIAGYTYSRAHYGSYNGDVVTSMQTSSETGFLGYTTYYLTFYNNGIRVAQLDEGQWSPGTEKADVYLVYTSDGEGGGGTVTENADVKTTKTAVLNEETGNYNLTLSIAGNHGTVENPAKLDIVIVVDKSGSMAYDMNGESGNDRERMQAVVDAVSSLTKALEENEGVDVQYNLITFSSLAYTGSDRDTGWTTDADEVNGAVSYFTEKDSRGRFENTLSGGTNYEYAFSKVNNALNNSSVRSDAEQIVIFLTDGVPTHRGTTNSWSESQDNDNRNYANTTAATSLLSSMNADTFYAIGIGPSFTSGAQDSPTNGRTNLNRVVSAARDAGMTSSLYTTQSSSELVDIFEQIAAESTRFAATNVTITDELSDYADLVLDAEDNPQFTITVTNGTTAWTSEADNNRLTFQNASGENVTVTASYNSETKTITLDFPDDYELEEGYTYSVSTVITPSEIAKAAGEDGYDGQGEAGTGTHSAENGFYSNDTAQVTYTANGEEGLTAFPKPVIQVNDPEPAVVGGDDALKVTKSVSGYGALSDFDFELTLTSDNASGVQGLNDEGKLTASTEGLEGNQGTQTVSFGDLTFTAAGEYTFEVAETTTTDAAGWAYDNAAKTITVTVTDDGSGQLKASVEGNDPTVENEYSADGVTLSGDDALKVTKSVSGYGALSDFDFELTLTSDNASGVQGLNDEGKLTASTEGLEGNQGTQTVSFGDLTFTAAGEYTFEVAETTTTDAAGWAYDNAAKTITVTVTDDGSGQLKASVEGNDPTVENEYKAGEGTVPSTGEAEKAFNLTKLFTGRQLMDGDEFTFILTGLENAPMPDGSGDNNTKTITVSSADFNNEGIATIDFGSITYSEVGDYTYTVVEKNAGQTINGVAYANNTVTITVKVTDNGSGTLVAAVSKTGEASGASFVNEYSIALDYNSASGIAIEKTLENHGIAADQFEFTVTAENDDAKTLLGGETSKVISSNAASMGDNGNAAETLSLFDEAQFTDEDSGKSYEFTVAETKGGNTEAGYTNDKTVYTVTINVSDDPSTGVLTVTTEVEGNNGYYESYTHTSTDSEYGTILIPFTNTYTATGELGGDSEGSVSIDATKTTTGRSMAEGEYSFVVTASNGTDSKRYATGTNVAAGDGEAGSITFSTISYSKAGLNQDAINGYAQYSQSDDDKDTYTYAYTVSEVTDGLADSGITATQSSFQITVTVTDNDDGTLSIEVTYPDGSDDNLAFANTYATNEVSVNFNGAKQISSNGFSNAPTPEDIAGEYTFTLTGSEDAPMPENTTVANDVTGSVDFGSVTFTLNDVFTTDDEYDEDGTRSKTFTYTVSESGTVAGVTNDGQQTFTVTVTDDGNGELTVTTNPSTDALFTFMNSYSANPEDSSLTGDGGYTITKELTGRSLNDGEFGFALVGIDGTNTEGWSLEATNDADGIVSFGGLTFESEGTYRFDLYEANNGLGGVSYDTTHHTVTAEVTDNGDGTLSVAWSVEDIEGNAVTFQNIYTASATSVTLGGAKVLDGRELEEGEFSFVLKDADGNELQTVTNAADGSLVFDTIEYTEAGTYEYTVAEVAGDDSTITYDDTVYTVTVTVVDNGKGQLVIGGLTYNDEAQLPVFTNVYTAPAAADEGTDVLPKTGDTTSNVLPAVLVCAGVVIAGGAVVLRKRMTK